MRDLPVRTGQRREGRWRALCRAKARGHQRGRRLVQGRVEVAAHDRMPDVVSAIDPGQQFLDLKQPQGIIADRSVEMRHVDVDGRAADVEAGNQGYDVLRAEVEVGGLLYGEGAEERLALDLAQSIRPRLL